MIYGHTMDWWLIDSDLWYFVLIRSIFDFLGSGAFLFIAGMSTMLSYRSRKDKAEASNDYNISQVRNEYMLRAVFILIISLCYNLFVAITLMDLLLIWNWFILLTVAVSLFIAWPLLKTTKYLRVILAIGILIGNQFILALLLPYERQFNVGGLFYHVFYGNLDLDPIFSFFPFFLIGTVVGDVIYDIINVENLIERKTAIRNKLIILPLLAGAFLIIFGVIFQFPDFFHHRTFSWFFYSLGLIIVLNLSLISIDLSGKLKTKKSYRFLYYFSYYSFIVYLVHNLIFFLFFRQLNWILLQPFSLGTIIIIGVIIRAVYKSKWRKFLSIKLQIGLLSAEIASRIEKKK
jgi:hypothetical protein